MSRKVGIMERFSGTMTRATGSSLAFVLAVLTVVVWAATGPMFHFSDTWQLVINTGTTIVTFLIVFLIQRAQNKDAMAIQLKLNELVAAIEGASNRLINIDDYGPMNETYMEAFGDHRPARSAVAVAGLPLGALVEVEAWAFVGS